MKYKFTISPEGIKRTLSDMFTSEITFLTEICQNSQRAGATNVDIKYSEESRVLTITDDGHGFTEQGWESFFTVGSSGWGDDVMKEQNPFGIGCAACLYAATEIKISSKDSEVFFETEALFSGEDVARTTSESFVDGTIIRLILKEDINIEKMLTDIESVFEAFTIPITVNGNEINRSLAIGSNRDFIETELGMLKLVKSDLPNSQMRSSVRDLKIGFILQGYKLKDSDKYPDAWIHLQSNKFRARVPDRDCLVGDVSQIRETAKLILKSIYKQQLVEEHSKLKIEQFVINHWFEAMEYAPELIKDAPIPDFLFMSPDDIPYEEFDSYCQGRSYYGNRDFKVHFPDDLKDKFVFDALSVHGVAEDGDPCFLIGNYAYLVSNQFIESSSLPVGHWLRKRVVQTSIGEDDITSTLTTNGVVTEFCVSTAGFYGQAVVLCDSFELNIDGLINLSDEPVAVGRATTTNEAIWYDGKIYIPSECNNLNAVCRQTVNVNKSEWDFELDEDYLNKVEDELWSVVRIKRGGCITELLRDLIQEHNSELNVLSEKLIGKHFQVSFANEESHPTVRVLVNEAFTVA